MGKHLRITIPARAEVSRDLGLLLSIGLEHAGGEREHDGPCYCCPDGTKCCTSGCCGVFHTLREIRVTWEVVVECEDDRAKVLDIRMRHEFCTPAAPPFDGAPRDLRPFEVTVVTPEKEAADRGGKVPAS